MAMIHQKLSMAEHLEEIRRGEMTGTQLSTHFDTHCLISNPYPPQPPSDELVCGVLELNCT